MSHISVIFNATVLHRIFAQHSPYVNVCLSVRFIELRFCGNYCFCYCSWIRFNAGSWIIENNLSGCLFLFLAPAEGPILITLLTWPKISNFFYFQQSLQATFYWELHQILFFFLSNVRTGEDITKDFKNSQLQIT